MRTSAHPRIDTVVRSVGGVSGWVGPSRTVDCYTGPPTWASWMACAPAYVSDLPARRPIEDRLSDTASAGHRLQDWRRRGASSRIIARTGAGNSRSCL